MKTILFGAGTIGKKVESLAPFKDIEIAYVVDNDSKKWGKTLGGKIICDPKKLLTENRDELRILISVSGKLRVQISKQLESYGLVKNVHFFIDLNYFGFNVQYNTGYPSPLSACKDSSIDENYIRSGDWDYKLFVDTKNEKVYRTVADDYAETARTIFERCKSGNLNGSYIVETEICCDTDRFGNALTLAHKYIKPVTYSFEWAPNMFREYCLFMIDMLGRLDRANLGIRDTHHLNATFYSGSFLLIDFGVLTISKTDIVALDLFIRFHINPLLLMLKSQISKAYLYLKNPGLTCTISDVKGYLTESEFTRYTKVISECEKLQREGNLQGVSAKLREFVVSFEIPKEITIWQNYQDEYYIGDPSKYNAKQTYITRIVEKLKPRSLIDLAGNEGWFGFTVRDNVDYAIVNDLDYKCVDTAFNHVISSGSKNVIPAYFNLVCPTLDYYRDSPIGATAIKPWRAGATARLRCEMALALAVCHHLVFHQQLTFSEIIGQLKLFTSKYLIVEFVEKGDVWVKDEFWTEGYDWYTKANFEEELRKHFLILEETNSFPSVTRTLYLCELL